MSTKANWRWISVGSPIWYKMRNQWRAGLVVSIGKNRKEQTVCMVGSGLGVKRYVSELYVRNPALDGKDKPDDDAMRREALAKQQAAELAEVRSEQQQSVE